MSGLMEWLEDVNSHDTRVRAVLRRSLAFDPGTFPDSFTYVEPFVGESRSEWRRTALYLAAGLWASHWRPGRTGGRVSLGQAAAYHAANGSPSTERRFIGLLDADEDQLPYRLRQMVALLKDQPIDFDALLRGLLYWNDDRKRTQIDWARDFYRNNQRVNDAQSPSTDGAYT
jgi:CRISPR system Cascade subunit CasB